MSELSCDTPFIGQIETHDLSLYHELERLQVARLRAAQAAERL